MHKWSSSGGSIREEAMKNQAIVSVHLVTMKNVLKTVVVNRQFCPQGHLAMLGDIFGGYRVSTTGI